MAANSSDGQGTGIPCPVAMGFPSDKDFEKYQMKEQRKAEKAARKRITQNESYCLLLKKELPSTRLTTLSWCMCGSCVLFTAVRENVCCREALEGEGETTRPSQALEGLRVKVRESRGCVIDHPSFQKVVDRETLEIVMGHVKFALRKQRDEPPQDANKRFRYCAYRSFVFWCYGHLGLGNRYELPACVRGEIMKAFPSTTGVYAGFKGADGRYASMDCDDEDWRESAL